MGFQDVAKMLLKGAAAKYGHNQQRKAQKASAVQGRAGRGNVLVNKQSNNDPLYVMYGTQRMGGTRVYVESSDGAGDLTKTHVFNMAVAVCEGQIFKPTAVYFGDTTVWDITQGGSWTTNAAGGFTLTNFISKYASTIALNWYPGSVQQTVDIALQTSVGSSVWTNDHRLRGVCYFTVQLEADAVKYGGQLPTITMLLEGKHVIDVSTITDGMITADLTAANYVATTDQNPADVLYDYLVSYLFGKDLDRDANGLWLAGLNIDLASFQQARIDCDAARGGLGYNINGFIQTEKQLFDNVGEILETCNGMMLFVDGKYQLRIRKKDEELNLPTSSIFTKDNIIDEILLSMPTKSQKLNKTTGTFNNPTTNYNDDVIIYKNDAYIIEDNGSVLESQEDYTLITNKQLVLDLITQSVEISRDEYSIAFTAAHTALLLRSGDIIEVRHDEFGWGTGPGQTQKFWRVQELTLTEDNTVEITATVYNSALEL